VELLGAPIFIGYRRRDSQGFAGRITDDLIDCFGVNQVFRDDDIPEGSDFTVVLEKALSTCSVLIAVVGPNWLGRVDGLSRLHQPNDWVRQELEAALKRGIWVQPILVGNASMPSSKDVPDSLVSFTKIQAVKMSDRSWERDLDRLVKLLNRRIPSLTVISRECQVTEYVPLPRDTLQSIALAFLQKQTPKTSPIKRSRLSRLSQILRALIVRVLFFGCLALVGWYLFEHQATPEFRKNVFDFLAFAQNKITGLIRNFVTP